mmetsp:Transcript_30565/g.75003  ORF Transcript_30565/g.75003 Transcript_30565/m.75003 type:complete len:109 (-) Transcript_30565:132-458(-)
MMSTGRIAACIAASALILAECVEGFAGVGASGLALRSPAGGVCKKGSLVAREMQNPFGGLFGGDNKKKEQKKDDLEDAIDDWKEIGFDINEVLAAEEKAKKDGKKDKK